MHVSWLVTARIDEPTEVGNTGRILSLFRELRYTKARAGFFTPLLSLIRDFFQVVSDYKTRFFLRVMA